MRRSESCSPERRTGSAASNASTQFWTPGQRPCHRSRALPRADAGLCRATLGSLGQDINHSTMDRLRWVAPLVLVTAIHSQVNGQATQSNVSAESAILQRTAHRLGIAAAPHVITGSRSKQALSCHRVIGCRPWTRHGQSQAAEHLEQTSHRQSLARGPVCWTPPISSCGGTVTWEAKGCTPRILRRIPDQRHPNLGFHRASYEVCP